VPLPNPLKTKAFLGKFLLSYANYKRCFLTPKNVSLVTVLFAHKGVTLGYFEETAILQLKTQLKRRLIAS